MQRLGGIGGSCGIGKVVVDRRSDAVRKPSGGVGRSGGVGIWWSGWDWS